MAAPGMYPAPARTPTAAEHQMVAAVLMPRTWIPSRRTMRARATRHAPGAASGDVTAVTFGPAADRRNAADRAHRGDLEGALGVISAFDTGPRRGAGRRLAALTAVLGPGLVVMAADNDAGGISTYAQAGQDYGVRIAWLVVLLVPVLFVCQEMAARLGAVTGAGHARLITARFGRR